MDLNLTQLYLEPVSTSTSSDGVAPWYADQKHPSARYHRAPTGKQCGVQCPEVGYYCTRYIGHTGEHEAHMSYGELCKAKPEWTGRWS